MGNWFKRRLRLSSNPLNGRLDAHEGKKGKFNEMVVTVNPFLFAMCCSNTSLLGRRQPAANERHLILNISFASEGR